MSNHIQDARNAYAKSNGIRFTQEDAARHFGVSIGTYRNWEQGRVETNAGQISELADFYGTTSDYLLGKVDTPTPPSSIGYEEKRLVALMHSMDGSRRALLLAIAEEFARKA